LFAKIDIEGFEFVIPQELGKLRQSTLRGVQISLHPRLYQKSLWGPAVWRRIRAIGETWRLIAYLKSQLGSTAGRNELAAGTLASKKSAVFDQPLQAKSSATPDSALVAEI
jgi:hypothetical protein